MQATTMYRPFIRTLLLAAERSACVLVLAMLVLHGSGAGCAGCDGEPDDDSVDDDTADDDTGDDDTLKMVTTFAGSPGGAGLADGVGNDAYFFRNYGISYHDGLLYVSAGFGETIRAVDPVSLEVTTIAGLPGMPGYRDSIDGQPLFDFPAGLEQGPDGLIYVADRRNGRIRVVDPLSGDVSTLHAVSGEVVVVEPFDVTFDDQWNLYFTDMGDCTVYSLDMVTLDLQVVAGVPGVCTAIDGPPQTACLGQPRGIAWHPDGGLYFADRGCDCVRRIDLASGDVQVVFGGGTPTWESGFVDDIGAAARFNNPNGLTVDGEMVYVADAENDAVRACNLTDLSVVTIAGIGINGNADGPGDSATLCWPVGLTVGGDGDLYAVDVCGHNVRRIALGDPDYTVTTPVGAVDNSGAVDGVGIDARMTEPRGLALGEDGLIWLLDTDNTTVRTIDLDTAEVATVAGGASSWGHWDGVGPDAGFTKAVAGAQFDDQLFIVEFDTSVIRRLDINTTEVTTIAGQVFSPGLQDGTGTAALFDGPRDIVEGGDGLLYILDSRNRRLRSLDPISLEVATLPILGTLKVPAEQPMGVAFDGGDTLYVTDSGQCVLLAFSLGNQQSTVVAGEAGQCEIVDGVGGAARLDSPQGVTVDPLTGLVYFAEPRGHVVRAFDPGSGAVVTVAGDPAVMAPVDGPALGGATFSWPVEVLAVDGYLLVLDQHSANVRAVELVSP